MEQRVTEKISYSIREASTASGIGRTTLYQLIKAGELTPVKIGTRTLIRRADLDALLARKLAA
jgi:excisionase family DNA binding protein